MASKPLHHNLVAFHSLVSEEYHLVIETVFIYTQFYSTFLTGICLALVQHCGSPVRFSWGCLTTVVSLWFWFLCRTKLLPDTMVVVWNLHRCSRLLVTKIFLALSGSSFFHRGNLLTHFQLMVVWVLVFSMGHHQTVSLLSSTSWW